MNFTIETLEAELDKQCLELIEEFKFVSKDSLY